MKERIEEMNKELNHLYARYKKRQDTLTTEVTMSNPNLNETQLFMLSAELSAMKAYADILKMEIDYYGKRQEQIDLSNNL